MPTSSINKRQLPWRRYGIAAIAAGSIFAAFLYWRTGDVPDTPPSSSTHATADVFGPGVLNGNDNNASLSKQEESAPAPLAVPGRLTAAPNQHLVVDAGLFEVINFFLLEQSGPDRANALQAYLKSKLPPPAYSEASTIVSHYQAYMKAYDTLLQGQNFAAEDISTRSSNIGRLTTWREQRDRLRLNLLGESVVQAWYQNDDVELNQVLGELQQRAQSSAQNGNGTSSDVELDEMHEQNMQRVLAKATKSFSTLAHEGQQWTAHLAEFQAAVSQINQHTEVNSYQREHQIQKLLEKIFPTDEERQRARDQVQ